MSTSLRFTGIIVVSLQGIVEAKRLLCGGTRNLRYHPDRIVSKLMIAGRELYLRRVLSKTSSV